MVPLSKKGVFTSRSMEVLPTPITRTAIIYGTRICRGMKKDECNLNERGQKTTKEAMVKYRSNVSERIDQALGWVSTFLGGARTSKAI